MKSTFWYWLIAAIITLGAMVYQRVTGPTHSKLVKYEIDGKIIKTFLPRSGDSGTDCKVEINAIPDNYEAILYFRHFPTKEEWVEQSFQSNGAGKIFSILPNLPAAGKYEYYIVIKNNENNNLIEISKDEPVAIRFKNSVPAWALVPHIILIFIAMLFSNVAGTMALFKHERFVHYGLLTLIFLFVAGFIFGPLVQYFAFGQAWTGFPFGYDLTDNKTLIAFIGWAIAVYFNRKEKRPYLSLIAAILMIIVYSIPHSLRGSELNYETGKVVSGFIPLIRNFFPF